MAVKANKCDIIRLFENLLSNAHEALEDHANGTGSITVITSNIEEVEVMELGEKAIAVKVIKKFDPPALQVQFINNGPQIKEGDLMKIFGDRFTTKPKKGDKERGGGLSTCQEIVKEYSGIINSCCFLVFWFLS